MNRSYRILPTYTGDVSGICAALYDMGGMVVMHDPSGCNSTYNTHDETRWYQKDSLIYISGVSEMDAILGNDDYFVEAVCHAAEALSPRFIALASSPVPYMNGTDFPALARLIENETGIPSFFVKSNGMHDYVVGAGNALAEIAERFVLEAEEKLPRSLNILGLTPMDYAAEGSLEGLINILAEQDWQVVSHFGAGADLDAISMAGSASVNLVVSALGLKAAMVLQKKYGTPYVAGVPMGAFAEVLLKAMETAEETGESQVPYLNRETFFGEEIILIGEPVTMGSLAFALSKAWGKPARVLCPLAQCEGLYGTMDQRTQGEEGAENALKSAKIIVADPMYRYIAPKRAVFLDLPHLAMSGRCFRKQLKNLFELNFQDWSEKL